MVNKWDQYVYSYVPKEALDEILTEDLYGGQALLKRPDLLEIADKFIQKLNKTASLYKKASSHMEDLKLINECLQKVEATHTMQELFDEYDVSIDEIYLVPICFAAIEVSARTDKGIIYLNEELRDKPEEIPMYLAHELRHFLDQTTGDGPTQGSNEDNYLDNPAEIAGFNTQTEFLSETEGDETAKAYVNQILDYHEIDDKKEREERKEQLLQLANQIKRQQRKEAIRNLIQ